MLESLSRRSHGVSLRSNFLSNKPHFFRIIHPALVKDGKPEIPKRFLREYGKHLSNIIFLKVPTGAQWRIELMKRHGDAWLQGGWEEFCDFYSIGYGHFLLFRYDGGAHFHVLIFDRTASEIEYPSNNPTNEKETDNNHVLPTILEENHESDVSVKILHDFPPKQTNKDDDDRIHIISSEKEFNANEAICLPKIKEKQTEVSVQRMKTKLGSLQPNERKRKSPSPNLFDAGMKFQKSETKVSVLSSTPEFKDKVNFDAKESGGKAATQRGIILGALPPVTASKKPGALIRALSFKPQNPFFVITMQPSYVIAGKNMNIPLRFVKGHFTTDNDKATLCASNGRSWSVRYHVRRADAKFSTGWGKFAGDNCLQVGDVCVFELLKPSANLLKVVIFRK